MRMDSMTMAIVTTASSLLGIELDQGVDTHDGDAGLDCALELFDFAHAWLEHAGLDLVDYFAFGEVESVILVVLLACNRPLVFVGVAVLDALRERVTRAELGDQLGGVLGGVDGECLWDNEQGGGEFADRELFARAL